MFAVVVFFGHGVSVDCSVRWLAVIPANKLTSDEILFLGFKLSGDGNKETLIVTVKGLLRSNMGNGETPLHCEPMTVTIDCQLFTSNIRHIYNLRCNLTERGLYVPSLLWT